MVIRMTKQTKQKNNIRLRRRIRKTIGALSLASALAVASIPVDTIEAVENLAGDTQKVVLEEADSNIPQVNPAADPIYTTGDGVYDFAYVYPKNASDTSKIAVILEYNEHMDPNVNSGVLTIPNTVDAYKAYDPGTGTGSGNVAVNSSDQYMFYLEEKPILDEYGNYTYGEYQMDPETGDFLYDESGNKIPIESTLLKEKKMSPCYYRTYSNWQDKVLYLLKDISKIGSTDITDYQMVSESIESVTCRNLSDAALLRPNDSLSPPNLDGQCTTRQWRVSRLYSTPFTCTISRVWSIWAPTLSVFSIFTG